MHEGRDKANACDESYRRRESWHKVLRGTFPLSGRWETGQGGKKASNWVQKSDRGNSTPHTRSEAL